MSVQVGNKPAAAGPGNSAAKAPAIVIPFQRASRMKENLSFQTVTTVGATVVPFGPIQVPANGYMRFIELDVVFSVTGNAATVAGVTADAPWNIIGQISLTTSSGDSLMVPVGGFALFCINKFGTFSGTAPFCDPRADSSFTAPTVGAGATAGSFNFNLKLPMEIDQSSGYGSLPNLAANRSYFVQGQFNPLTSLFTTPPNGTTTVTITAVANFWAVPNATNANGDAQQQEPVGNGSFSVWQLETIPVTASTSLYTLHNVGNVIRQIIMIYRDVSGVRTATANSPALFELVLNNDELFYRPKTEFIRKVTSQTGYGANYGASSAALGTAQGQEQAVWPWLDFLAQGEAIIECNNPRDQYLPTLDATLLQVRGTAWGVAGTLEVYTNSVVPISANSLYAPHF